MKVEIESVSNGFILKSGMTAVEEQYVYSDNGHDKKYIVEMLYQVLEAFGEVGSKHDPERVRIIRVNQDGKEIVK